MCVLGPSSDDYSTGDLEKRTGLDSGLPPPPQQEATSLMIVTMYALVVAGFVFSLAKDVQKTKQALRASLKIMMRILPSILGIIGLVGLIMGLLPPSLIAAYIGPGTGFIGTVVAAVAGAVTMIPSLISFPLAASLLEMGASTMTIAAFITTLTMVGIVTAPIEIEELGLRFTIWRNALGFSFALVIALIMGVILG